MGEKRGYMIGRREYFKIMFSTHPRIRTKNARSIQSSHN